MVRDPVERRLRQMLLRVARERVPARLLAERLSEELGVRVPASWERIEELVMGSEEIDARELAAVLVDLGVEVPEEEWVRIVSSYRLSAPRLPGKKEGGTG